MHLSTCYNESTLDTHAHTHTHSFCMPRSACVCNQKQLWMGIPIWGETRAIEIWNCLNRNGPGQSGAWQLGSPGSRHINQTLISWIRATRKNVNRPPGDGSSSSWVFSLPPCLPRVLRGTSMCICKEAEENGKKNMIVLLPCEIKFFSYRAAFDFAFKLARALLANSWETLDAVRSFSSSMGPGATWCWCCSCASVLLRVLVDQNERTTDCRLKAFPMRTLYMVIWQLFDASAE